MAGGACRGYGGRGGLGMVVRYGPKVVLRIGIQSLNFPTSFWSGLHLARLWHHARMQQDDEITLAITSASRSALLRAATRLLGPAEAEDAVQDAYVRALEANAQVLNAAQAWLLTVVRNLAIDRLRRRQWMAQWLAEVAQAAQEGLGNDMGMAAPSAEADASLAQQATLALYWLAVCVTPVEGAAVLLHAVFDVSHAELAQARGGTVAASRQQLRRALQRVRQVQDEAAAAPVPAVAAIEGPADALGPAAPAVCQRARCAGPSEGSARRMARAADCPVRTLYVERRGAGGWSAGTGAYAGWCDALCGATGAACSAGASRW